MTRLFTGADWTFEALEHYERAIAERAEAFGLDTYANQIEVITAEQMLDAYTGSGLPVGYPHWTLGKAFILHEQAYRKGYQTLAYEMVINSNPCIAYLMEENTTAMQALVIAHASFGHDSFFKGNYLFRQWTEADAIIDYLVFARRYVAECEERHGEAAVEAILDSCHALSPHGVNRFRRPNPLSTRGERAREAARLAHEEFQFNNLWRTVPKRESAHSCRAARIFPAEPEENILYFIEKYSPVLEPWQRELARIVRKIAQYFYPQVQTKVMNEGWATFWHYHLLNQLYDDRLVDDGFMLEVLQSHTAVVAQRGFDQPGFGGINPYTLGFAMFQDLKRVCVAPTEEDRRWHPDIAGGDWRRVLDFAMRTFKDESFIGQFLSPRLIREFRLFAVADHEDNDELEVDAIHDEWGYRRLRKLLSAQYARETHVPDIQVTRYERDGDRSLTLRHTPHRNRPLASDESRQVLKHLARLWGFTVRLEDVDETGGVRDVIECMQQ